MRVAIHQPEFAPWLGFFHKASLADTLIVLDDVQFRKNYFQNRNRIRTARGWAWITVPVERTGLSTKINEVRIAHAGNPRWVERAERSVAQAYSRAPHFARIFEQFCAHLRGAGELLVSVNIPLLQWMLSEFGLRPQIVLSSSFGLNGQGSQRILELCQAAGATTYVSGISGREYLQLKAFQQAGITVEFQEFRHPIYPQLGEEFLPQISALEALFLFGPDSGQLLTASWSAFLDTVFT